MGYETTIEAKLFFARPNPGISKWNAIVFQSPFRDRNQVMPNMKSLSCRLSWALKAFFLLSLFAFGASWAPVRLPQQCFDLGSNQNLTEVHSHFMGLALKQAKRASDKGEVPIGAVVVAKKVDGSYEILSQACNLVESTHDASAHAELLAMRQAAKKIKNWRLTNTTLYTTLEPCPM